MALFPWRFQADLTKGETNPMVTVFLGAERSVMDADGNPTQETFIEQSADNPGTTPLSGLAAALADPSLLLRSG